MGSWFDKKRYDAYVATLFLVTAGQVKTIKAALKEGIGFGGEQKFLATLEVSRVEDIRDFERALALLEHDRGTASV